MDYNDANSGRGKGKGDKKLDKKIRRVGVRARTDCICARVHTYECVRMCVCLYAKARKEGKEGRRASGGGLGEGASERS